LKNGSFVFASHGHPEPQKKGARPDTRIFRNLRLQVAN